MALCEVFRPVRLLDTHEQKSPRFLIDAFPDIEITVLEVGDYFSGKQHYPSGMTGAKSYLEGNLVEIKIGKDGEKHTETLERMQEEFYRMACYRQKNPHVCLHAVWLPDYKDEGMEDLFNHLCFQYHIWGHIIRRLPLMASEARQIEIQQNDLIHFLKALDQPSQYKEFEPYIKRSHEEPTILAKMLRQIDGVSSEKALLLAECKWYKEVAAVPGMLKKTGDESKLCIKIMEHLRIISEYYVEVWL